MSNLTAGISLSGWQELKPGWIAILEDWVECEKDPPIFCCWQMAGGRRWSPGRETSPSRRGCNDSSRLLSSSNPALQADLFLYVFRGRFNNPGNTLKLSTDRQRLYVMISFNKRLKRTLQVQTRIKHYHKKSEFLRINMVQAQLSPQAPVCWHSKCWCYQRSQLRDSHNARVFSLSQPWSAVIRPEIKTRSLPGRRPGLNLSVSQEPSRCAELLL